MFKIESIRTKNLTKNQIKQICILKKFHWNFSIKSQLRWFLDNVNPMDIHVCVVYQKKIIGYTLLRSQILLEKKKLKFYIIDTVIVSPKFRNRKISNDLMNFNNSLLNKYKKLGVLHCNSKMIKFYNKFSWKKLNTKKVFLIKPTKRLSCMVYNDNYIKQKSLIR